MGQRSRGKSFYDATPRYGDLSSTKQTYSRQSPPSASVDLRLIPTDLYTDALICEPAMNTLFLLMAQYDARAIVPAETVCRDYFSHLTLAKFLRKVGSGEIDLPLTRSEKSQKSARGVHIQDLAEYLDKRRTVALAETRAFQRIR